MHLIISGITKEFRTKWVNKFQPFCCTVDTRLVLAGVSTYNCPPNLPLENKQECIPVGCVPSVAVADMGGGVVCLGGCLPDLPHSEQNDRQV